MMRLQRFIELVKYTTNVDKKIRLAVDSFSSQQSLGNGRIRSSDCYGGKDIYRLGKQLSDFGKAKPLYINNSYGDIALEGCTTGVQRAFGPITSALNQINGISQYESKVNDLRRELESLIREGIGLPNLFPIPDQKATEINYRESLERVKGNFDKIQNYILIADDYISQIKAIQDQIENQKLASRSVLDAFDIEIGGKKINALDTFSGFANPFPTDLKNILKNMDDNSKELRRLTLHAIERIKKDKAICLSNKNYLIYNKQDLSSRKVDFTNNRHRNFKQKSTETWLRELFHVVGITSPSYFVAKNSNGQKYTSSFTDLICSTPKGAMSLITPQELCAYAINFQLQESKKGYDRTYHLEKSDMRGHLKEIKQYILSKIEKEIAQISEDSTSGEDYDENKYNLKEEKRKKIDDIFRKIENSLNCVLSISKLNFK
jgi:hypothetical protein